MKYKYRILITSEPTASEEQLNFQFGEDGWLLNQIYQWQGAWYYVFTREDTGPPGQLQNTTSTRD